MSSSNPRNTPNLSVPLSQSTAPVTKFNCLFTHDVRRKAKRWHDGFLRFHTFNKRVMVYDASSNFIGDLHWRETEDVQDGDEMELDKGVLIQVGECIGKTETDLTPIFDKRKQDQTSPPPREPPKQPVPTPRPRITAQSQQRDTSLSAILGIKRSSIENLVPTGNRSGASDPATHIFTSNNSPERPPKRRREAPEITQVQQNNSSVKDVQRAVHPSETPRGEESPTKTLPRANPPRTADKELPKSTNLVSRPASHTSRPTSNRLPEPPVSLPTNTLPPKPESSNSQGSQSGTLRIATQKPRKKLMYNALLPQNGSQGGSQKRQRPPSNLDSSVGLQNVRTRHGSYPTDIDLSGLIEEFSSDDFPDAPIPPHTVNADEINESPSDSTLIALADIAAAEGTPTPRIKASPNSIGVAKLHPEQESQRQTIKPALTDSPYFNGLKAEDTSFPPHITRDQHRQFTRSHSETGALNKRPVPRFPSSPPLPPQRQEPSGGETRQVNPTNMEMPAPKGVPARTFQRSVSDLSSLRAQNSKHSHAIVATGRKPPAPIPEEDEDDQGPWTSEALDLFDWWPPGKPKPAMVS
ncbi:hypothetical protein FQN54_007654 [Arachnomyces sp. PD_36]|nr:hypothetical protein FQN54_007654 [Arachnomyces sp. PD_36]